MSIENVKVFHNSNNSEPFSEVEKTANMWLKENKNRIIVSSGTHSMCGKYGEYLSISFFYRDKADVEKKRSTFNEIADTIFEN